MNVQLLRLQLTIVIAINLQLILFELKANIWIDKAK